MLIADKLSMDFGLDTSINTGDPISEGVHAGKFGIGVGHIFKSSLAPLQLLLVGSALGPAHFDEVIFGILSLFEHSTNGSPYFCHQLISI